MPRNSKNTPKVPAKKRRRKLLLAAANLSAGTLLTIGCGEADNPAAVDAMEDAQPDEVFVTSNPKGTWYDDAGYDSDADSQPDAQPEIISNPKGSWYDDAGYDAEPDIVSPPQDASPTDDN